MHSLSKDLFWMKDILFSCEKDSTIKYVHTSVHCILDEGQDILFSCEKDSTITYVHTSVHPSFIHFLTFQLVLILFNIDIDEKAMLPSWQNIRRNINKCPESWQAYRFSDICFDWFIKLARKSGIKLEINKHKVSLYMALNTNTTLVWFMNLV